MLSIFADPRIQIMLCASQILQIEKTEFSDE